MNNVEGLISQGAEESRARERTIERGLSGWLIGRGNEVKAEEEKGSVMLESLLISLGVFATSCIQMNKM